MNTGALIRTQALEPRRLLEHWPQEFITIMCSWFMLILLFVLILNAYVYLVS